MMIKLDTRELHLAAYMRYNGAKLISFDGKYFIFESDINISDWRISHTDSDCYKIDRELLSLKRMVHDKSKYE